MSAGRISITENKEWGTPESTIDIVKNFFGGAIDLDPCSNIYSKVKAITEYILPNKNGLEDSWDFPTIFVNPPYGRDSNTRTTIYNWLSLCKYSHLKYKSEIIALIPVATNTRHWKDFVFPIASSVCFLSDTRVKFLSNGIPMSKGAPMACCLVYYGDRANVFFDSFSTIGNVVNFKITK